MALPASTTPSAMWPAPSLSSLDEVVECAKRCINKPYNSQGRLSIDTTAPSHTPGPSTPPRRKSILKQPVNLSPRDQPSAEATTPGSTHNWSSPQPGQYHLATSPLIEVIITRHEPVGTQHRLADLENRQALHWPFTNDFIAATRVDNGASVRQSIPRALLKEDSSGGSAASIVSTYGGEGAVGPDTDRGHTGGRRDGSNDESDYVGRVS